MKLASYRLVQHLHEGATMPQSALTTARLLCVDDDRDSCELLAGSLRELGYETEWTTSPAEALHSIVSKDFHAVISDLDMAEMDGLELCKRIQSTCPGIPVIMLTGQGSLDSAIGAVRARAHDFITKPVHLPSLELTVARAVRKYLRSETVQSGKGRADPSEGSLMVGDSSGMRRVTDLIQRVAKSDASVLILGETGTGKELVARALHAQSGRGPFVAVNCAAVAPNLLESELFGHMRGAFTDAKSVRRGLFLEASGGTLFLDEVGEMPLEMQAKLLRVLQERTVRPVGSDTEHAFDVRIITATHRDLGDAVATGSFREDLFYRINVVSIDVPPLRERGNDVLKLASHFLRQAADRTGQALRHLSPPVADRMLAYEWPGNVRELENCIERAVALSPLDELTLEELPDRIRSYRADKVVMTADTVEEVISLEELERRYIARALRLLNGNKARTAQLLGIDRRTLYRHLGKHVPPKSAEATAAMTGAAIA
jgi:DNA-binding NtrC family response regulator